MSKFNSIFQKTFSNISEAAPTPGTSNSALPSITSLFAAKNTDQLWKTNFLKAINATITNSNPGQLPTSLTDAEKKTLLDLDAHYNSAQTTTNPTTTTTTPAPSNKPVV
jgi:hypothetical protein